MAGAASWSDEVCAEVSRVNLRIERRGDGAPLVVLPSFSPNHRAMGLVVEPVFIGEEAGNWERWGPPTELDAPVCLLTGRRDRVAGYRDPLLGLPYLPQADYTTLANAGHYLPLEQPQAFAALVQAWLRRC